MSAPTSIAVSVDREEYSRFENDRNTILVTLDVQGSGLLGEEILVELRKARFERDVVVTSKTVTLAQDGNQLVQVSFYLPEIINAKTVPIVRRGKYFMAASSVTNPLIEGESADFRVSLITIDRLKADYLHGTDQFSSDQLTVVDQPRVITGVTVDSVSLGHPKVADPLSYNYAVTAAPSVLGTTSETFALTDGMTLVLRLNGGAALTATFNTADFVGIGVATAAEVAGVINTDIPGVVASDVGGSVQIVGDLVAGTNAIFVDPSGTATTILGLLNQNDTSPVVRTLSWGSGPSQIIEAGRSIYTLQRGDRQGSLARDYIKVRVSSIAALPFESHAELLIIDRKPLDDERMRAIVEQAVSWVEDVELAVYLEPTRITTEIDPTALLYPAGQTTPSLAGADWDEVVDALEYTTPAAGHWIGFKSPYYPLIGFEELFGKLSNTRIVDISLEWVELHETTGWVELVPFNQETAFNFIGLVWVESLRGPVPLPNFWNFTALVGFRETPAVLIELVAKKAAIDILVIAGQAFRGGFSSQSISRDGISESVSYTASAMYGIYSATTEAYQKWVDSTLKKMKGAFRGVSMVVM
jgi:hypothetical protein